MYSISDYNISWRAGDSSSSRDSVVITRWLTNHNRFSGGLQFFLYTVNRENSVLKIFHVVFFHVRKFSSFLVLTKFLYCCNYCVFNFSFFCV